MSTLHSAVLSLGVVELEGRESAEDVDGCKLGASREIGDSAGLHRLLEAEACIIHSQCRLPSIKVFLPAL
jgi:hypothetical protein